MSLFVCIIYIVISGIIVFILGRLFPKHIFIEDWYIFKCFDFEKEGEIYKKLNIASWQKKVPDMSKLTKGLMKRKEITSKIDIEDLVLMIRETCIAELSHYLLIIIGIGILFIMPFPFNIIIYLIYTIFGNLIFCFIQRYNRPRLNKLLISLRKEVVKGNKLLILSSNNGGGHNSVANSIKEEYETHGYIVDIKDGMSFVSPIKSKFESVAHNFMYKYLPTIYSIVWNLVERNQRIFFAKYSTTRISLRRASKELNRFINDGGYSTVICCHVFAGMMLSDTIKNYDLDIRTGIVETDYMNSPGSEYVDLDYHFIPVKDHIPELIAMGIPFDKIVVSGIPIRRSAREGLDKKTALRKLKLNEKKIHILIMFGAEGNGPIKSIIRNLLKNLEEDCFISVICGKNEKLYKSLKKKYINNESLRIIGYSSEVTTYMDASDIIITKAGGISLTEAAIKDLGIVIFKTIGGCEEHNKNFFVVRGAAISPLVPAIVAKKINSLLSNPKLLKLISDNACSYTKANSTEIIFEKLELDSNAKKGVWTNSLSILDNVESYSDFYKMMDAYKDNIAGEVSNIKRTYQEYKELSKYALGNFEKYHFKKNDVVGLMLENCLDWPVIFWGLLSSGAIPLLINPNDNSENIESLLKEANAKYYVSNRKINNSKFKQIDINSILKKEKLGKEIWGDYVGIATSGTTGKSRIFLYDAKTIAKQIISFNDAYLKNEDLPLNENKTTKLLAFLPFNHIFGFSVVYLLYSCMGKTIVYLKNLAISTVLDTCKQHQVTNLYSIPMFFNYLASIIENRINDVDTSKLRQELLGSQMRTLIVGGGHTPSKTLKLINDVGYPLYNGFGMSECGVISVETSKDPQQRSKGSIGLPFSLTEYKLDRSSELLIRGDGLYTASIIDSKIVKRNKKKWLKTGDIAKIQEDGLYILGRNKDVIINDSGENIYPDVVEDYFSKLTNINNKCILGIKEEEYERLVLVVEANMIDEELLIKEVSKINISLNINQRISRLYLSKKALPISSTNKVKRNYLKQEIEKGNWPYKELKLLDSKSSDKALKNDEEYQRIVVELKEIISKAINVDIEELHENDNLLTKFTIDSLSMINIIVEVEKKYHIDVINNDFKSINSISDIAYIVIKELKK